jgi:DNA-binding beta-propeller fold protein YncE
VKTVEQQAKPASAAKIGGLAVVAGPFGRRGRGCSSLGRLSLLVPMTVVVLALGASCALAAPPVSFGEPGEGAGQMAGLEQKGGAPTGIAVEQESGDVYVNDDFNSRVDKFGPEGEFLLSFGWGVVDGAAELQVCGPEAIVPTLTCRKGILEESAPGPGEFGLGSYGVAVDNSGVLGQQGDVYVHDSPGRVTKFGPHGEFLFMLGGGVDRGPHHPGSLCTAAFIAEGDTCGAAAQGTGPREFEDLDGNPLAVGPTGTLYVGDAGRVQKFSPAGAFEGEISLPGVLADEIAVDSVGDIYVAAEKLNGVHKYNGIGTELGEPRDPAFHSFQTVLAIGPADELFVLGANNGSANHIDLFDSSGKQLSTFLNEIRGSGRIPSYGIIYGGKIERLYNLDGPDARVDLMSLPAPGPLPLPHTTEAKEIHKTDAVLCAEVNPEDKPTTVHFDYITEAKYKQDGEAFGAGTEETTESASIGEDFEFHKACQDVTGLSAATSYRFRIVASNENGPPAGVLGEAAGFETQPPFLIDATFATGVGATSAILDTEINPLGEAVSYHFEYDTAPYLQGEGPHGTAIPVPDGSAGAGEVDVLRSAPLYDLAPETTYYYRVVAHSTLAVIVGPGGSFTTQSAISGPPLLDGRAWERVSPSEKAGSLIRGMYNEDPEGVLQAAADGNGLAFVSIGSFGQEAPGNRSFFESQFLASRGADGWTTKDVTPPREDVVGAIPGNTEGYKAFSEDLSVGALQPRGVTPLSPLATETTPYLRAADGEFLPLVDPLDVPPETAFDGKVGSDGKVSSEPEIEGGSPDLHSVVISSCFKLTEDAVNSCSKGTGGNVYVWHEGALQLASILPNNHPAAATGGSQLGEEFQKRHAVSDGGTRLVFSVTGSNEGLYLRDMALAKTVRLDLPEPGAAGGARSTEFEDMSADGSKVFFTDYARLTIDSDDGRDLYMCEIVVQGEALTCALKDLSVARNVGEDGAVLGESVGMDSSGRYVYFEANGALAPGAAPGDCNSGSTDTGTCDLYLYDTVADTIKLVTTLSGADYMDWGEGGGLPGLAARVSPNGRFVAFVSRRSLTGYDNRDAVSGQPDVEVYLYDRLGDGGGGKLVCASCDPTGARPHGVEIVNNQTLLSEDQVWRPGTWVAAAIPGWTPYQLKHAFYQSRYLSDSGRLFFDSADTLVPRDSNGTTDVYEYEPPQGEGQPASNGCTVASPTYSPKSGGCVDLISSGASPEESEFLDASESGDDVFFLTGSQLVPADVDTALDIYDARVGGAVSEVAKPPACEGDACQNPVSAPEDPTPGSLTFRGPGNPLPPVSASVKAKAKPATRAQKLARALKACTREPKRKRAACERQARRSYGPVGKGNKSNRGAHR